MAAGPEAGPCGALNQALDPVRLFGNEVLPHQEEVTDEVRPDLLDVIEDLRFSGSQRLGRKRLADEIGVKGACGQGGRHIRGIHFQDVYPAVADSELFGEPAGGNIVPRITHGNGDLLSGQTAEILDPQIFSDDQGALYDGCRYRRFSLRRPAASGRWRGGQ